MIPSEAPSPHVHSKKIFMVEDVGREVCYNLWVKIWRQSGYLYSLIISPLKIFIHYKRKNSCVTVKETDRHKFTPVVKFSNAKIRGQNRIFAYSQNITFKIFINYNGIIVTLQRTHCKHHLNTVIKVSITNNKT